MSGVSGDAATKDSGAVAGSASGSANDGKSVFGAAAKNASTNEVRFGSDSSVRGGNYEPGFWMSLLFAALLLLPVVLWAVINSIRNQEAPQDDEVVYKNLNVLQIYGRITKKY